MVLVMLVALLGASLAGWRVSSAKSSELKGQLIVTKILAESATEAAMVQAKRIKELNDEVDITSIIPMSLDSWSLAITQTMSKIDREA